VGTVKLQRIKEGVSKLESIVIKLLKNKEQMTRRWGSTLERSFNFLMKITKALRGP